MVLVVGFESNFDANSRESVGFALVRLGHQNASDPAALVGDHPWAPRSDLDSHHLGVIGIVEDDFRPAKDALAGEGGVFREDPFDEILELPDVVVGDGWRVLSILQKDGERPERKLRSLHNFNAFGGGGRKGEWRRGTVV